MDEKRPGFSVLFGLGKPQGLSPVKKLHLSRQKIAPLLRELEVAVRRNRSRMGILGRLLLVLDAIRPIAEKEVASESVQTANPSVRRAVEMLCNRIPEEWTLEKLGLELRLNPSYLVRLFHAGMGVSPMTRFFCPRRCGLGRSVVPSVGPSPREWPRIFTSISV